MAHTISQKYHASSYLSPLRNSSFSDTWESRKESRCTYRKLRLPMPGLSE